MERADPDHFFAMKESTSPAASPDFRERVKETATKLAVFAAKKATMFIPGNLVKPEDVDTLIEAFRPFSANDEQFEFINKFEASFDELVRDYVGDKGRLVVFVDDLDRCLPENAIQVLEAIKLYLDRANVTFVIGAERAVIEQGIRERCKGNVRLSAKEYLEKIVQLPFVMRGLSEAAALGLMLPYSGALGSVRSTVAPSSPSSEPREANASPGPKTAGYQDDDRMRHLVFAGTDSNPRRIKRFINTYYVLFQMSERAGSPVLSHSHQLAIVLLTQMRFPEIYDDMIREPGLIDSFQKALDLNVDQRDDLFRRRDNLRRMFEDAAARRFFEATKGIDCSRTALEPWVLLARGADPIKAESPSVKKEDAASTSP
jgi:hypothetical protein